MLKRSSVHGDDTGKVLDHFRSFGDKASPFLDTVVSRDTVKFRSPWTPPVRDLNAIAERFDVSYRLIYEIPGKPSELLYYTCLRHEPISETAERIRNVINSISTVEDLRNAELMAGELFYHRTLDLHDLGVIACLLKKQSFRVDRQMAADNDISGESGRRPWESEDRSTDRTRQR